MHGIDCSDQLIDASSYHIIQVFFSKKKFKLKLDVPAVGSQKQLQDLVAIDFEKNNWWLFQSEYFFNNIFLGVIFNNNNCLSMSTDSRYPVK